MVIIKVSGSKRPKRQINQRDIKKSKNLKVTECREWNKPKTTVCNHYDKRSS